MKTRKNIVMLAVLGLGVLILMAAWSFGNDYERSIVRGSGLEWSPVGTWVITVPTSMGKETMLHTVHSQDSTGQRYGGIMWEVTDNPTTFGLFPDVESGSYWPSQTVSTGPDTFESTFLFYGIKKGEGPIAEIVKIGILNATWTLTGPNSNEGEATLAMYTAEQDADGDGFPDEGQEPAVCMPFTYTSKRLTMMPGCVPTPMP